MARQSSVNSESVVTINPNGGMIDRDTTNGHRGGNGRNGDHQPVEVTSASSVLRPRLEQGVYVAGEGNGAGRIEGDREAEALIPENYFRQHTLPTLRSFVGDLTTAEGSDFTQAQEAHYTRVITALENEVAVRGETRERYIDADHYLEEVGGAELAGEIKDHYRAELAKALLVFEGYDQPIPAEQEKALLVFAEFMLTEYQRHSGDPEVAQRALALDPLEGVHTLAVSDEDKTRLGEALNQIRNHIDFSYITCWDRVVQGRDHYTRPDDPDVPTAEIRLNGEVVREHLRLSTQNSEGAYRLLVDALDRLDTESRNQRIETRAQNPEVILPVEDPLMGWQARVEERLGHALEGRDYINGCLGKEKLEGRLFGFKAQHENKHVIQNVRHKAPIRRDGREYEKLADVEAAEITLKATVYQGEWNQGKTLEPGQSASKDFFNKLTELTVWSVTLDSANKVENFYDQLMAAEAVALGSGMQVTQVLGRFEGATDRTVQDAVAFRVPVMNHRGQASFVVIDRATMLDMQRVCSISRRSYAELAQTDSRYKADSKEIRWAQFNPQLQEHQNTPENWVDQERDANLVEGFSRERINALREAGGEINEYIADQLRDALEGYTRQFNEFQTHYCRLSHYYELAVARLSRRGMESNAPDYQGFLDREINAVAIEYTNRWGAFRNITTRLLGMQSGEDADPQEILALQAELDAFLANIDYELEIQTAVSSRSDATVEELTDALKPFMRTTTPVIMRGRILENAYADAEGVYREASAESGYDTLSRGLEAYNRLSDELADLAETDLDNVTDIGRRMSVIGAKRALQAMEQLAEGEEGSPIVICLHNAGFLRATDDLRYPDNRLAEADMGVRRLEIKSLLDRQLTDNEINRFLDGQEAVIERRRDAVGRLQIATEYARGLGAVGSILTDYLDTLVTNRTPNDDENAELAHLISVSFQALSAVDLTQTQDVADLIPERRGGGREPLRIAVEHPGQPILDAMAITYENAVNALVETPVIGNRIRTRLAGVMI